MSALADKRLVKLLHASRVFLAQSRVLVQVFLFHRVEFQNLRRVVRQLLPTVAWAQLQVVFHFPHLCRELVRVVLSHALLAAGVFRFQLFTSHCADILGLAWRFTRSG